MQVILDFFVNNYIWFLIISLILIFALIGYLVDVREKSAAKVHFVENEKAFVEEEDTEKSNEEISKEELEEKNDDEQKELQE